MNFASTNNLSSSSDLPLVGGTISMELLSRIRDEEAVLKQMDSMDSSHFLNEASSTCPLSLASTAFAVPVVSFNPPDLYQEDDSSDVGPRMLSTPICLDAATCSKNMMFSITSSSSEKDNSIWMESATAALFNQALFRHVRAQLFEAKHMYQSLVHTVQNLLRNGGGHCMSNENSQCPSTLLLEMGMRVHNNLGVLMYKEGDDLSARTHFQAALLFSKQLIFPATSAAYQLEHANILSNWCRVDWMRGDIMSDQLYGSLREILRIRSTLLAWDHADIAAAHFNLAAAEYARQKNTHQAVAHLMQYLHVAAHHRHLQQQQNTTTTTTAPLVVLDPMPALIYLLLLQHEDKDDSMSQELVRGLRTLQDKRSSISSSHDPSNNNGAATADVASVLNFIGTLLFHKQDLEHALLFFQEELRLEEQMMTMHASSTAAELDEQQGDISVSVTCNNIGRILQELEKFEDAIMYYERALQAQYGDCSIQYNNNKGTTTTAIHPDAESSTAAANLYSTVWYNLGLIHDKRGCYAEAIVAFKMSLELRSSMLGRDHPDIACLYYNIGVLQMEQQQLTDASDSLREALRVRCHQQRQQQHGEVAATASNQLNDERVIKTLEKLASMHKNNGAIVPAIDALRQVIRILQVTTEYDTVTRMKDLGLVLRSIAELYHTMGDVNSALIAALHSVRQLEFVVVTTSTTMQNNNSQQQQQQQQHHNVEQLVSSLLLVGSLHHEMNEPIQADCIFRQAVVILESTIVASSQHHHHELPVPSSLYALREVAAMLATTHCAPEA